MKTKRAKVIMLDSKGRTKILRNKYKFSEAHGNPLLFDDNSVDKIDERGYIPQHLYIITDDKIKEGDWFYYFTHKGGKKIEQCIKVNTSNLITKNNEVIPLVINCYKIIATTDKSLMLPQPSKAFIEKYCKIGGIDKVLVECEQIDTCSGSCVTCNGYCKQYEQIKIDSQNTITIHPIRDSYNRGEVVKLLKQIAVYGMKLSDYCQPWQKSQREIENWIDKNL